jgi:hypothetical protein
MNWRAYGVTNHDDNALVTGCCSNTLLKAKQAINFSMLNKHVPWIDGSGPNDPSGRNQPNKIHAYLIAANQEGQEEKCRGQGVMSNDKQAYSKPTAQRSSIKILKCSAQITSIP